MTENSFPWNGTLTGDHGPYSDEQWAGAWRRFFTLDPASEGVLPAAGDALSASNTAGRTVRVAPGAALVDGVYYQSSANVDFTLALPSPDTNRYDRIVVRKSNTAQTVRLAVLEGVESAAPALPTLTQVSGETWEIPLAKAYITAAGVITLTDERAACRYAGAVIARRQGGDPAAWNTPGSSNYTPIKSGVQCGAASITLASAPSGQVSITFPSSFTAIPLVIASTGNSNYLAAVVTVTSQGATLEVRHRDNSSASVTVNLSWAALGTV